METERLLISLIDRDAILVLTFFIGACLGIGCSSESTSSGKTQERGTKQSSRVIEARAQTYLLQAEEAFQQGSYQRALALADSAEQYDRNAAVIPFFRGNVYSAMSEFASAQKSFQVALQLDPEYPEAYLRMGDNAYRRGNNRDALDLYKQEATIAPSASLYERIGRTYTALGVADSARRAYEKALQRDSTNATAHLMYGQLLEEAGQLERALQHSHRAVDLKPDHPNHQYAVGSQLYQLGRLEEAVVPLRKAADGQLLHYPAQYTLSQVLIRVGREAEAERYEARADSARQLMQRITAAEERTSRHPNVAEHWVRLGQLYRIAGEEHSAADAFSRAQKIQSQ